MFKHDTAQNVSILLEILTLVCVAYKHRESQTVRKYTEYLLKAGVVEGVQSVLLLKRHFISLVFSVFRSIESPLWGLSENT